MSTPRLAVALLGVASCSGTASSDHSIQELMLISALTEHVRRLDDLDMRMIARLHEPFRTSYGQDGAVLHDDKVRSFDEMAKAFWLGDQASRFIETLSSMCVNLACADDRDCLRMVARRELGHSLSILNRAVSGCQTEASVLGIESVEGRLGSDAAAALLEILKLGYQLEAEMFPEASSSADD